MCCVTCDVCKGRCMGVQVRMHVCVYACVPVSVHACISCYMHGFVNVCVFV